MQSSSHHRSPPCRSEPWRHGRHVGSWDRHLRVLRLAWRGRDVVVDDHCWGRRNNRRLAGLISLGLLERRGREGERLGRVNLALVDSDEAAAVLLGHALLDVALRVVTVEALRWTPAAVARGKETIGEARGVGCGLHLELGEVEIRAGAVAGGHGLSQTALGVVAVECDAVDGDSDDFDDDFYNAADQGPVLKTANESIWNIVFKQLLSLVLLATPAPDILTTTVISALVENGCTNTPHDDTEDEESDCECGIVNCNFLSPPVTTFPVLIEDENAEDERYAGNGEEENLRPDWCAWSPGR